MPVELKAFKLIKYNLERLIEEEVDNDQSQILCLRKIEDYIKKYCITFVDSNARLM